MRPIQVEALSQSKDTISFISQFSSCQQVLRHPDYRVGLLGEQVTRGFLDLRHFQKSEFWLAHVDGKVVGRIGASWSNAHSESSPAPEAVRTVMIGFFEVQLPHESADEIAHALLSAAKTWAKSLGATRAVGPMNYHTWFPYRFRIKQTDPSLFSWEPVNPPEYVAFFEAAGFTTLETYHSKGLEGVPELAEGTRAGYEKAKAAGYTFRPFQSENFLEKEVPLLYELSMEGFKDNFLFEAVPLSLFQALYVPIAKKVDAGLTSMAISPQGKPVGFFFTFQDGQYHVLKTVAVLPEARGVGLSNAVLHLTLLEAQRRGIPYAITALVRSGARSESYTKKAKELWTHEYALFEVKL